MVCDGGQVMRGRKVDHEMMSANVTAGKQLPLKLSHGSLLSIPLPPTGDG